MTRPSHVFDDEEPIYAQLYPGMVFVTRDGGHIVRVTRVDEAADEIRLTDQSTGDHGIRSGDEMWAFWDHEAFAVPPAVLSNPERVVTEYAWFHLSRDLETIGRSHEHHMAGSERVSDIEFALWATSEARRDNWPPDDAAGHVRRLYSRRYRGGPLMGAHTFYTRSSGEDAKSAFQNAVEDAQYRYGHAGYTGTIAEKTSFTEIPPDEVRDTDPGEYASQLIRDQDPRIDSKWGPAGCIRLGDNTYLFFGWASA